MGRGLGSARLRVAIVGVALALAGATAVPPATALGGGDVGVAIIASPGGNGYAIISATGGQYNYGGSGFSGSLAGMPLNEPIVDAVAVPGEGDAKWFVASDGGVFSMGTSKFYGSMGGQHLNSPVSAILASPTGNGYALVAQDGGVFTFGDFRFFGSLATGYLNAPIVDAALTPDGMGAWLLGEDGGVFTLGTAVFYGSLGGRYLNWPAVAILGSPDGGGYLIVSQDGGTFAYGDYPFRGSLAHMQLNAPIVDAAPYQGLTGVWLVARDGGVFTLNAPFYGAATNEANPPPSYPGQVDGSAGSIVGVRCSNGGTTYVAAQIAENVRRLYVDAAAAGLGGSCGGGYRSPEQQIALRKQNCGPTYYDIYEKPAAQCSPPTAKPGTSMHERGLAIDFTYNGATIGAGSPLYNWLTQNARNYGLYNYPREAWHWSTNGR